MEWISEHWLTIIIAIVCISIGWFFTNFYWKREWGVRHLTLVHNPDIPLMHSMVDAFPDLKMTYKDSPVSPKLTAFYLSIVNTGRCDIELKPEHGALQLLLPEGYKWESCVAFRRIVGGLTDTTTVNEQTMSLKWDILKSNESINLLALVDISAQAGDDEDRKSKEEEIKDIAKNIKMKQRIPDTQESYKRLDLKAVSNLSLKPAILRLVGICATSLVLIGLLLFENGRNKNQFNELLTDIQNKTESAELNIDDYLSNLKEVTLSENSSIILNVEILNVFALKALNDQIKTNNYFIYFIIIGTIIILVGWTKQLRSVLYDRNLLRVIRKT